MRRLTALLLLSCLALQSCGTESAKPTAPAPELTPQIDVALDSADLAPMSATVGHIAPSENTVAPPHLRPWAEHEVRLTNLNGKRIFLDSSYQTGAWLGDRQLIVTAGCGIGSGGETEPVSIACTSVGADESIGPHESLGYTVSIAKVWQA